MSALRLAVGRLRPDPGLNASVFGQGAGNALLNVTTFALNFAITILLSRRLGASGFGAYAFAYAVAMLLSVPAVLGLTPLLVREVTRYRLSRSWGRVRGLMRRANEATAVSSLVLCAGAATVFALTGWPRGELREASLLALLLVPLIAVTSVRQGVMQGLGRVTLGRAPEAVIWPGLLVLLAGALALAAGDRFSASWAIVATDVSALAAAIVGVIFLRRVLPAESRAAVPIFETRRWAHAAVPLIVFSLVSRAGTQLPTVLLGALGTAQDVGVYNVAWRVANILPFLVVAAMPALMPAIAELDVDARHDELQRLMTRSARLLLVGSVPLALGAIIFAGPLLRIFGAEFEGGEAALRILSVAYLLHIACGSPGTVLVMLGDANAMTATYTATTILTVALSAVLVPDFGANGAAVAAAGALIGNNVILSVVLWRRRRIYAPALRIGVAGLAR